MYRPQPRCGSCGSCRACKVRVYRRAWETRQGIRNWDVVEAEPSDEEPADDLELRLILYFEMKGWN